METVGFSQAFVQKCLKTSFFLFTPLTTSNIFYLIFRTVLRYTRGTKRLAKKCWKKGEPDTGIFVEIQFEWSRSTLGNIEPWGKKVKVLIKKYVATIPLMRFVHTRARACMYKMYGCMCVRACVSRSGKEKCMFLLILTIYALYMSCKYYIYIYIHIYAYIYTHMNYIYIYKHVYIHVYIYTYIFMHFCLTYWKQ